MGLTGDGAGWAEGNRDDREGKRLTGWIRKWGKIVQVREEPPHP